MAETGLLGFLKSPEGQGLLSAAFGGLASARKGQPLNNVGRAGMAGMMGYGGALDRQTKEKQLAEQQQMRALQMQQMQDEIARNNKRFGVEDQVNALAKQYFTPGSPAVSKGLDENMLPPELRTGMPASSGQPAAAPKFDMPGYANAVMGVDPRQGASMLQSLQSANKPISVAPGASLVDPKTYQPIYSNPKESSTPSAIQEYGFAKNQGYPGSFTDFKKELNRSLAPQTKIDMAGETAQSKKIGEYFGTQYADIQKAGFSAQNTINRYERINQLLNGVETGKFAQTGLDIAKAAQAAGFNIDPNVANKEAAAALSNEIALQLRNPAGGAGMPGAMSDKDREFLVGMVPGLGTTPEGRQMMMETAKKMAKRDMEVAKLAREYRSKTGTIDEGFYNKLQQFADANPLFDSMPNPTATPNAGKAKFLGFE